MDIDKASKLIEIKVVPENSKSITREIICTNTDTAGKYSSSKSANRSTNREPNYRPAPHDMELDNANQQHQSHCHHKH